MSITVYWASTEKEWLLAKEPELVSTLFYNKHKKLSSKNLLQKLNKCPAFNDNLYNLYAVRSIYDYSFTINSDGNIVSNMRNQTFFDEHVTIRSLEEKMFSFSQSFIFFTDEDSLPTTLYEFPVYEENNITQRCQPISGTFDIGKWFRNSEFPFFLKKEYNTFIIEREEIYMYIKFHTNKKIKFKQFRMNQKLKEYLNDGFALNNEDIGLGKLQNYYKNFKHKKLIIKEIQNNLL